MARISFAGAASYGAVTIGGSAALIKAASNQRGSLIVKNNHASNILYLGDDASVTTSNGYPLAAGESFTVDDFGGDVYGIASAASTDVRYFQVGA